MLMFDSSHSFLYLRMHCKIKKKVRDLVFEHFIKMTSRSLLLGSLTSRINDDHGNRSGVKAGDRLFCTIEPDKKHSDNCSKIGKTMILSVMLQKHLPKNYSTL